jgi:diadenosine tetraphosphate (Ap4A) HIT family hydrolase
MSGAEACDLHPRLAAGGVALGGLALCSVLLKSDARWPWLMLVPQRAGVTELHDLTPHDAATLMEEIRTASLALAAESGVVKINVAALGNQVAQLHVHVIGRWPGDPAWPNAVFSAGGERRAYAGDDLAAIIARLQARLGLV